MSKKRRTFSKMRNILEKDFNMDLTELDTLKNELEGKGDKDNLDEKDFEKITNVMSGLLKGMDNAEKNKKILNIIQVILK